MTVPAAGINKQLRLKAEVSFGTAPSASGAILLRRVTSMIDLEKQFFMSKEIEADRNYRDGRHGPRSVTGNLNGELSPGTYSTLLAQVLGSSGFTAGSTVSLSDVTAAAGPPGTFTTVAGNWLTSGFKIGDIIRQTGWTTTGAGNNNRNYRITALTTLVMTVGTAATGAAGQPEVVAAKASGDTVVTSVVGKKLIDPLLANLVDPSWSLEHWFSDTAFSELYTGCKFDGCNISLPASAQATIAFPIKGQQLTTATSQYFTSPTNYTTSLIEAAVNGTIRVNGVDVATITGLTLNIASGYTVEATVGSVVTPGVFPGMKQVSGQVTALFDTTTLRDLFLAETPIAIWVVLTTNNTITADFCSFVMNNVKLNGAKKDDKPGAVLQTIPFQAFLNTAGGTGIATDLSTLTIQDTLS